MTALAALAAAAVLVPVLWSAGERLLRLCGLELEGLPERFGLGFAAATAVGIGLFYGVAVLGFATFGGVLAAVALLAALGFPVLRRIPADLAAAARGIDARDPKLWGAGAFAFLALAFALAPPTGMDSTALHFVSIKLMAARGGLPADPAPWFHRSGGYTFVHLAGFVLQGEILAKLLNFAAFGAAMAVAAATAARLAPGAGRWAALLFAACPFVVGFWGYEWIEAGTLLYAAAAAFALVRALEGGPTAWLGAAIAFSGVSAGSKTSAFATLIAGAAAMAIGLFRVRPRPVRPLVVGSLLGALGFLLWPLWNRLSVDAALPHHLVGAPDPLFIGVPRSFGEALLKALDALLQIVTVGPYWNDAAGPLVVGGLAGVLLFRLRSREGFLAALTAVGLLLHLAFLVVAARSYLGTYTESHGRYVAPCLVGFGLPAAAAFARGLQDGPRPLRLGFAAALLVVAAPLLVLKAGRAAVAAPVVLGLESRDAYLSKKIETFDAGRAVDALPGEVRLFFLAYRPYYLDRRPWWTLADLPLQPRIDRLALLLPWIDRLRITHVVTEPIPAVLPGLFDPDELAGHPRFREIGRWPWRATEKRVRLYEVLPAGP